MKEKNGDIDILKIPNNVMKGLYQEYCYSVLDTELNYEITNNQLEILKEVSENGKIEKISLLVHKYLNNLSNRDYINFDERYIKFAYYIAFMSLSNYDIISEPEINRKYMDLLITPKININEKYSILIEFKYLKKGEENLLEETKQKAKEQILEYSELERIKNIPKLKKYTIVAVVDNLYVDEIE